MAESHLEFVKVRVGATKHYYSRSQMTVKSSDSGAERKNTKQLNQVI